MFGTMPCTICQEKNHSSSLEQLKRIRQFLELNVGMVTGNGGLSTTGIANAFMASTHNHCRYGISCPSLSSMEVEANNIAIMMEDEIIAFVQKADKAKLYELLYMTQGYFPQAYVAIERYWFECQKE